MAMFDEHFTFDAPRSPSLDSTTPSLSTREPSRSVSPCSPTGPFPPPRFSVTDLAATFANSRLRTDSQIRYDPCESYANMDDDAGWEIPTVEPDMQSVSQSRTFPQRSYSPSRRVQRQATTRLLCSTAHAKDIATLVSRMVECQEQCNVVPSEPVTPTTEEDEGYNSGDASRRSSIALTKSRIQYRRSSEFRTTGASVNKAVRLRKSDRQHKRIRSSESEA